MQRKLNPLRFLAVRIFAWFWLVLALTVVSAWLLAKGLQDETEIRRLPAGLAEQIEPALRGLQRADSIAALIYRLNRRDRNRWLVVDTEQQQVLNSQLLPPKFDQSWLTELSQLKRPRLLVHRNVILAGPFLVEFKGQALALYQIRPRPEKSGLDFMALPPYFLPMLLLLVSALASMLLAMSITKPLRQLQQRHLEFAEGALDVRISSAANRSDEIGQLNRGFNLMADKISDLLQNQQRLLRDVSHELRSPLTRAQLAIALEQRQGDGKQLPRLQQELERVDALLSELLTYSRLDAGQYQLQLQSLDLAELIEEILSINQLDILEKELVIHTSGPQPCLCRVDSRMLGRALENVIRNAIKYSPPQSPLHIDWQNLTTMIQIQIRDQGPGIPSDSLDKIFEPFYRVSDDRNTATGGTGLGLAIASQIIRQHAGRMFATLPEPGGLAIHVELPHQGMS